jgi:carboxymethylenebutenolidase
MCHSPEDRPAILPVAGASADEEHVVITSADGARFDAFVARSQQVAHAGIVVLPDSGGLSDFYEDVARRFAGAGIDAVTIDYYGRTAGTGPRPPDFNADDHMARTTPDTVDADVRAAAEKLRSYAGGIERMFTVGFCFGGAVSWRQSARGFDRSIGFYGSGEMLRTTVRDLSTLQAPLLLLVAEADPYFPIDDSRQIDRELTAANVEHETVVYPGAPHGFFSSGEWADVSNDAWERVLRFVSEAS